MGNEYSYKQVGEMRIRHIKPNYNIVFHKDNKVVGTLDFNGPEMTFSGDMDESAKLFFDWIAQSFKQRLQQERADEREACAKVCEQIDTAAFGSERLAPNDCAAAIRARGNA